MNVEKSSLRSPDRGKEMRHSLWCRISRRWMWFGVGAVSVMIWGMLLGLIVVLA